MKRLDAIFTPADFEALRQSGSAAGRVCVVFDVLRATSSMITALGRGAVEVLPVATIPEALAARARRPGCLLAGERDGLRITAAQTGSIDFDLGNSPREFTAERVAGRGIVMTTTNGTRALRACAGAEAAFAACFLNLRATAARLIRLRPDDILLVGSGTFEEAAYEDVLGVGALAALLAEASPGAVMSDAAMLAHRLWATEQGDLCGGLARSRNGRRLLSRPELAADVAFCARIDSFPVVAALAADGAVRVVEG